MRVLESKTIFIDSSQTEPNGDVRVSVPPHPFSVYGAEKMRLTLTQFSMLRNWYNVNEHNNKIYLHSVSVGVAVEFEIEPGIYTDHNGGKAPNDMTLLRTGILRSFTSAKVSEIKSAFSATSVTLSDPTYSVNTRKYTITISGTGLPSDLQLCCFHMKSSSLPTGVDANGGFNDSFKLLGARPIRNSTEISTGSFDRNTSTTGAFVFTSPFPGSLQSMDAIYIRTSLHGGNFHTQSFSRYATDTVSMVGESDILARVPLRNTYFDTEHSFAHYTDATYSLTLHQNVLDYFTLFITDGHGRRLSDICSCQFSLSLTWEALTYDGAPRSAKALPDHSDHDCRFTSRLF